MAATGGPVISRSTHEEEKPRETTLKFIQEITTGETRIVHLSLSVDIIVRRNVFPVGSQFSHSSIITAKKIPEDAGKVLDVGTGTGVQGIIAAKRGAKEVLLIDIDDNALENARENVLFNNVDLVSMVEVRKSDLFENIKPEEKFNLIIAQLPFADKNYQSSVGHLLFDPNFALHERFLREAKGHLEKDGKIFIPSGEIANEEKLQELIRKYDYDVVEVQEELFGGLKWKLYVLKDKDALKQKRQN